MKTLLFIFAVAAAFRAATSLDCYVCELLEFDNDYSEEVVPGLIPVGTDENCDKPKSDSGYGVTCNSSDSSSTDYCLYTVGSISGTYGGEKVGYTLYSRKCGTDSSADKNGDCEESQELSAAQLAFATDTNFTVKDSTGKGECYCNNKDFCNSNSASYMTGSLLALMSAAILRLAL